MMMRKLLAIAAILLSFVTSAVADSESDKLLDQLVARSQSIQSLEGVFEQQKTIAVLPMPLSSNGRFSFEQGKEVVWETLVPIQSRMTLTPGGIRLDDANGIDKTPAQASPQKQQAGAEIVAKIFMGVIAGELDSLRDYFTLSASGTPGDWKILLQPRSENLAAYINEIELRGGEFTEHLDIREANGDNTYIVFATNKVVRKPVAQPE